MFSLTTTSAQVAAKGLKPEQYLTLLELSKAIASHRDLTKLFHDLACRLQMLFKFRSLAVMFHDSSRNILQSHFLETCAPTQWQSPKEVPIEGSVAGWVWEHQEPVVVHDIDREEDRFPFAKTLPNYPVKAICSFHFTTVILRNVVFISCRYDVGIYVHMYFQFTALLT